MKAQNLLSLGQQMEFIFLGIDCTTNPCELKFVSWIFKDQVYQWSHIVNVLFNVFFYEGISKNTELVCWIPPWDLIIKGMLLSFTKSLYLHLWKKLMKQNDHLLAHGFVFTF